VAILATAETATPSGAVAAAAHKNVAKPRRVRTKDTVTIVLLIIAFIFLLIAFFLVLFQKPS
jgi:hypothetical protein